MTEFEKKFQLLKEKAERLCPKNLPTGYSLIFKSDQALHVYLRILEERQIAPYREIWESWYSQAIRKATELPRGADFIDFIRKQPTIKSNIVKKAENINFREDFNETHKNTKTNREILIDEILALISNHDYRHVADNLDCINFYVDEVLVKKQIEIPYKDLLDDWANVAEEKNYPKNSKSFMMFMQYLKPKDSKNKHISDDKSGLEKTNRVFEYQKNQEERYNQSVFKNAWEEIRDSEKWKDKKPSDFYFAYEKGQLEKGELMIIEYFRGICNPPPEIPIRVKGHDINSNATRVAYSDYYNETTHAIKNNRLPKDTVILDLKTWYETT